MVKEKIYAREKELQSRGDSGGIKIVVDKNMMGERIVSLQLHQKNRIDSLSHFLFSGSSDSIVDIDTVALDLFEECHLGNMTYKEVRDIMLPSEKSG